MNFSNTKLFVKLLFRTKVGTLFCCVVIIAITSFCVNHIFGSKKLMQWTKKSKQGGEVAAWMRVKKLQGIKQLGSGWNVFVNKGTRKAYCKFPELKLDHDAYAVSHKVLQRLKCSETLADHQLVFTLNKGYVQLAGDRKALYKYKKCVFAEILRVNDDVFDLKNVQVMGSRFEPFRFRGDFLKVSCYIQEMSNNSPSSVLEKDATNTAAEQYSYYGAEREADYEQFLVQVDPQKSAVETHREARRDTEHTDVANMNIAIIGFDSLSHMSWRRNMPKSYHFLKEELKAVVMNGYNIVGDGTSPAYMAMFTGKYQKELPEVRKIKDEAKYLDELPWMWNRFELRGYSTLLAEDEPSLSTFNLRYLGFEEQPANHYMRHFWQAVWDSDLNKMSSRFCLGSRQKLWYHLQYLRDMYRKYPRLPKFSLFWHAELTHADNNPGQYGDDELLQLLQDWQVHHVLNNTLLLVLSDHGARNRASRSHLQGRLEERLPLLTVLAPQWFRRRYPRAVQNLQNNANRLVSPFDIYATLLDLLQWKYPAVTDPLSPDHKSIGGASPGRSISLFRPIPETRTCESADIPVHFCSCMTWQTAPLNDPHVLQSANLIKTRINKLTNSSRRLCQEIDHVQVTDAKIVLPNEKVLKYYNSLDDDHLIANFTSDLMRLDSVYYQLTLEATPGQALFEATVLATGPSRWKYEILDDISRLDRYKEKSKCVLQENAELRQFCACRSAS